MSQSKMTTLYDNEFYSRQRDQSLESARIVVPLVMKLFDVNSVVDVGCGMGGWLRAFADNGVARVRGLDGDYVDLSQLYVSPEYFTATDLTRPFETCERFELAVCLEVAEHLPARSSRQLVHQLSELAPVVLFSASLPGQGGTGHINEQWPEYWRSLFAERGFAMLDVIRPSIREDQRIEWWYRQNIVIFASQAVIAAKPGLSSSLPNSGELEWLHVNMLRNAGVRNLLVHLWPALQQAVRKRLPLTNARATKRACA